MSVGVVIAIIVIALMVGSVFYFIGIYNRLTTLGERHKNAFSQIEVQLQRRYDLIPNLVETVKAYLKHEQETLTRVVEARNTAVAGLKAAAQNPGEPGAMKQLAQAESGLRSALGQLSVVVERYPDLKADSQTGALFEELTSTENKVAFARQAFNDAVTSYNIYKKTFPPVVVAGMTGHASDAALLEFDSAKIKEAPKVSF
jgi:LemA protein